MYFENSSNLYSSIQLPISSDRILATWTKDRLINGTLGEEVESKLLGYVKRAVLSSPEAAKVENLFPDPDEEVTLVIAAAKKEKELCETRKGEETARSVSSAVASTPSSSAASGKGKNRVQDAGQGICHLRAVQARLFPFRMFPACAVVASASFLCA